MLKLFISYSHEDKDLVSDFVRHIAPLENNGHVSVFLDRKIETGKEFQEKIDDELENSDIICLMISSNFLSSKACMKEKEDALELKKKKGIRVIPLILRPCVWDSHKELRELLAIPTDGKAITSFPNQDEGWVDAISSIRQTCKSMSAIKNLDAYRELCQYRAKFGSIGMLQR